MPRTAVLTAVTLVVLAAAFAQRDDARTAAAGIVPEGIRSHLYFLSHDVLEGRGPGARGGDAAALYIAAQMKRMRLAAVDGSHFQQVPLSAREVEPGRTKVDFEGPGAPPSPRYPDDLVVWAGSDEALVELDAPVIFAGYGVHAPEYEWDDFKELDVRGALLLVLAGEPPAPPDEPALFDGRALTYYGRWTYKVEEAQRRGAAGILLLHTDDSAGYPWSVVQSSWTGERLFRRDADERSAFVPLAGWIRTAYGRRLLESAGLQLGELYVRAARRDFRPVDTGIRLRATVASRVRQVESANVLGMIRGSDPQRRHEVVVYTAHYDHLGIGPAIDGDSIYNGAYDNASGVAALLEIAAAFTRLDAPPARSVLFLATTAEEAGLLGAEHYVRNPPAAARRPIANINLDGVNLWGETEDMVVLGGERSTLGETVEARAQEMGLRLLTDRAPEQGFYFRSDHFAFARIGIPSVAIEHGIDFRGRPAGWGSRILQRYHSEHYHRPTDRYDPGFDLAGAVQQARLAFLVGYDVAEAAEPPRWREATASIPLPPAPRP